MGYSPEMTVKEALEDWEALQPSPNRACCPRPHYFFGLKGEPDRNLNDDQVCPRERAWRIYTRIRDKSPLLISRPYERWKNDLRLF